ncbi:2599_t:CDS:2 [Ambispora leptoticha]|uniref:2599_t:CDS:1 n=1 Tax=Ambispora leptoticha TaxID=144679 RepID=A0A9N8VK72_9GLOM|nr:2599_t:CDS:2 [Ambispora leptoticha]
MPKRKVNGEEPTTAIDQVTKRSVTATAIKSITTIDLTRKKSVNNNVYELGHHHQSNKNGKEIKSRAEASTTMISVEYEEKKLKVAETLEEREKIKELARRKHLKKRMKNLNNSFIRTQKLIQNPENK